MKGPGNPNWTPGNSGNPNGRPVGSRNKRTQEVLDLIKQAGHQDPLFTLSELQSNSKDEAIRAQAAHMLAPYVHSKVGAVQPLVFVIAPVILPYEEPTSTTEVRANFFRLDALFRAGDIDLATYNSLKLTQEKLLYSYLDETKVYAAQGGGAEQTIRIEGGMPDLPGTSIILPNINGKDVNLIAAPSPGTSTPGDPSSSTDPSPGGPEINSPTE